MAITPTGAIYKALSFDNVSSRNYGVYITGQAVYNAPTRDVEMISIPGRNGAFALDKGRFENIEVSYPAGIFADNETDFAEAISNFRNFLCSRNGYVRLSDEYNPNEYRMAIYKSGLEVTPAQLKAGEFEIVFDCKPQRWLTSGETAITVSSGDTVTNPTLFESSPLLKVEGYGNINLNGFDITINNEVIGTISYNSASRTFSGGTQTGTFSVLLNGFSERANTGDPIKIFDNLNQTSPFFSWFYHDPDLYSGTQATITVTGATANYSNWGYLSDGRTRFSVKIDPLFLTVGTAETKNITIEWSFDTIEKSTSQRELTELSEHIVVAYDGDSTFSYTFSWSVDRDPFGAWSLSSMTLTTGEFVVDSTASILGHPTYIDCDLGEVYMLKNGVYTSLNKYVDLGSNLPSLSSGTNTVTFDNTVTDLKVVPRWWKV